MYQEFVLGHQGANAYGSNGGDGLIQVIIGVAQAVTKGAVSGGSRASMAMSPSSTSLKSLSASV